MLSGTEKLQALSPVPGRIPSDTNGPNLPYHSSPHPPGDGGFGPESDISKREVEPTLWSRNTRWAVKSSDAQQLTALADSPRRAQAATRQASPGNPKVSNRLD